MARLASFHLVRHHRAIDAMTHLATARRLLRQVPGLAFWRVLGTGRGADTGPSADLRRTALFAVWDVEPPTSTASWRRRRGRGRRPPSATTCGCAAIGGHGTWRGVAVLAGLERGDDTGPIAVVTRADVRAAAWRRFRAVGPVVSRELQDTPGLLAVAGVGELPVGRLGTFSVWRDVEAVTAFARSPLHADVVRRTRAERWYGEELFARFEPFGASGSWDGRDPLDG